jgi:hypothetical protein
VVYWGLLLARELIGGISRQSSLSCLRHVSILAFSLYLGVLFVFLQQFACYRRGLDNRKRSLANPDKKNDLLYPQPRLARHTFAMVTAQERKQALVEHKVITDVLPGELDLRYDLTVKWPDVTLDKAGEELGYEETRPQPTLHLSPAVCQDNCMLRAMILRLSNAFCSHLSPSKTSSSS